MCMCMLHVTPCLHKQPRVYDPQGAESLPLWLFGQGGGGGLAVLAAVSRPGQGVHRHGGRLRRLPVLVGHAPSHCARRGRALGAEREEGAPRAGVGRPRAGVRPPSHKSTRFARPQRLSRGRQAPRSRRASRRAELLRLRRHQPRHSSPPARSDAGEPWLLAAAGAAAPQALAQRGAAIWAIRGARARLGGRGRFPRARSIPSSQRGPRRHEGPMC